MPMHSCNYCNYKSNRINNLKVHQKNKHGKQQIESQLKTSYMHDYQQEQPAYCGQVAQQQPVYHNQVPLPSHMQNNSNMTSDLDINQELNNLKDDYESLIEQNKILIQENQHLKNYLKHYNIKH